LSAIPIGVTANLVRITVTAILHRTVGSYMANLVFHDLAGWLMMPLALAMLWLELKLLSWLLLEREPQRPLPIIRNQESGVGNRESAIARRPGLLTPHS